VKETTGRIILKWVFGKWDSGNGLHWSDSKKRHVAGSCECGNEHSGSTKCVEFLD
jgi:hypothetical protein